MFKLQNVQFEQTLNSSNTAFKRCSDAHMLRYVYMYHDVCTDRTGWSGSLAGQCTYICTVYVCMYTCDISHNDDCHSLCSKCVLTSTQVWTLGTLVHTFIRVLREMSHVCTQVVQTDHWRDIYIYI